MTTAFISYSHLDRAFAAQAKKVLSEVDIKAFLAHEDLEVSEVWQKRILTELRRCDLFVPILSTNFLLSKWASQEVGFIVSRPKVTIAPLSIDGTTPYGFISHVQSSRIPDEGISIDLLVIPLARKMPRKILPSLIDLASRASSFRSAESLIAPLTPLFPLFTPQEAQALAQGAVKNGQIWSASLCREKYLPEFIRIHNANISHDTLEALRYQIVNDEPYRAPKK